MRCEAAKKWMSRHLDGELSPTDQADLEEHLAQCSSCGVEHATQQRLWALLTQVEPIEPPEVIAAVEARLLERRRWASPQFRSLGYAMAAAAVVGLFVGSGIWAGKTRTRATFGEQDRAFAELLADAPPGMEVVTLLDDTGEDR